MNFWRWLCTGSVLVGDVKWLCCCLLICWRVWLLWIMLYVRGCKYFFKTSTTVYLMHQLLRFSNCLLILTLIFFLFFQFFVHCPEFDWIISRCFNCDQSNNIYFIFSFMYISLIRNIFEHIYSCSFLCFRFLINYLKLWSTNKTINESN